MIAHDDTDANREIAVPMRSMKQDDALEDFKRREIVLDGTAKMVHVAGSGPAVIVMTEMPGISPHVARFARWVRDAGFTVYMPSLFGRDGAVPQVEEGAAVLMEPSFRGDGGRRLGLAKPRQSAASDGEAGTGQLQEASTGSRQGHGWDSEE